MADQTQNSQKHTLVALDIAKKTHDAVIYFPSGKTVKMKVFNTLDGYSLLLERARQHDYSIQVAFEPTADYHRNIAHWLHDQGCECFLVSSLSCARAREMLFNTWDKNDRKDAAVILYLMQQGLMRPFYDPLILNIQLRFIAIAGLTDTQTHAGQTDGDLVLLNRRFGHLTPLRWP